MKKLLSIVACLGMAQVFAQTPCESGRFAEDVFENVTVTSNIVYGQNTSWSGSNTTLYVDFYEPTGDVMEKRPLIIWVHGGSFLGGSRTDSDMVAFSQRFAKKGYACASISYRTGFFPIDSTNSVRAVVRAVQDLKAAIRFFYKDAETDDTYRVDTSKIFIGGSSAGAITALHVAYLTEECELYDYLNASQQSALGGLEGSSGNPGYPTKVKGVLNGAGALARYSWMDPSELNIPLVSVHGTNDGTVTYNRGIVNPGVPLMYLDGSRLLHERACAIGLENDLYTFNGAGHVPYIGGSASALAYMDTTVNFYRDFLVRQLGCSQTALQPANNMAQQAVLYPATYCDESAVDEVCATSGLNEVALTEFVLYPNPATHEVRIEVMNESSFSIAVLDLSGRMIFTREYNQSTATIDISALTAGNYLVQVKGFQNGTVEAKKLIVY
jgi:poly(3-hydroxybutyrate) depolymerase